MGKQSFTTSSNPQISIRVSGDFIIRGWDRNEISFEGGDIDTTRFQQVGDVLEIETADDCRLMVPNHARLEIQRVGGDAVIRDINEPVILRKVGGDVEVRGIESLTLGKIGGDLSLEQVGGDVTIDKVGGDFGADQVKGRLNVASAGGDMDLRGIGSLQVAAGGDVYLEIGTPDPLGYEVNAGGDFKCSLPDSISLNLQLESGGQTIQLGLPGLITKINKRTFQHNMGLNAVPMKVDAGGDIKIICPSLKSQRETAIPIPDSWDNLDQLGERISRQVEEGLRTADFSARLTSEMTRRTEAITKRALRRAQERIDAAMQKLDDQGVPLGATFQTDEQPASVSNAEEMDAHEPVSDEERMIILQMLEEKKISVDEAQRLLDALEGGG